jgi:hypothetical protein
MLFNRFMNHISSAMVEARAQYSASVVERYTVACFLAPYDNKLVLIYMAKPNMDRRSFVQPA